MKWCFPVYSEKIGRNRFLPLFLLKKTHGVNFEFDSLGETLPLPYVYPLSLWEAQGRFLRFRSERTVLVLPVVTCFLETEGQVHWPVF